MHHCCDRSDTILWSNSGSRAAELANQAAPGWRPNSREYGIVRGWSVSTAKTGYGEPIPALSRAGSVDQLDCGVRHHEAGELGRVLGDDLLTTRPRDRGQAVVQLDKELAHA
jgi:hypothetical protein